ncbi:hypothetical protein D1815_16825 [Aquimarina sp. AD1]|uniref:hypothetical protein n=1 Tax=Aquimarina sp. (strain AD1) TaxID=1714848 RepID=UPI000E4B0CB1|nr:hypothetical protein [Aquimarina sp. AD1]AXT57326.1 hypothetical protein D1815_16825 [Aquimarina sp. AD1]RKN03725.1 hypothetical protein D7035_22130 [Aquimarina sp. AD1]
MSNKENSSEEIDLGQLFKLIGDGFNKLFRFIANIFKVIFHTIILVLQFIRIHFLKFVIAGIIGLAIGWYWDSISENVYRSSMIVEPNFDSSQQLYNNIEFYNELAKEGAYKTLAASLKISDKEAETITKIKIEAFSDDNQKLKQFSDFVSTLDSISRASLSYEEYLKNFNNINSRFHKIELKSKNPEVAKKCQNAIVRSIENNDYFNIQKQTNELNLRISDSVTRKQLVELDSLKLFYQNLKLLEIKKPENTAGTNINLSSENQNLDRSEITLLKEVKQLNAEIIKLNERKADSGNIINVISDFPDKGGLVNDFFLKKKVLLPIGLVFLTFLFLILLLVNKYLKNYNSGND